MRRRLSFIATLLLGCLPSAFAQATPAADPRAEFFEANVRPLLLTRCTSCHGEGASAGLRLDNRNAAMKGGRSGVAILPGKPDESLLIQAVAQTHATLKMPLNGRLAPEQVAALRRWVADGAVWPETAKEHFLASVQPLLAARCAGCHGDASPAGGLSLTSAAGWAKGGKSGAAGLPALLLRAVRQEPGAPKMPPSGPLDAASLAVLERWVNQGAVWPADADHAAPYQISATQRSFWSFQPVKASAPPTVASSAAPHWTKQPIDRFLLQAMQQKGLQPGQRADRRTLIRRLSFDLLGLPPKPAEVEAFVKDTAPDAYARLIDRLLASPHYGERWGRHWLDLARYADTAGDAADFPVPEAYKYRNWVIEAFNKDLPYDQFVRAQIAGDLLPAASEEARWSNMLGTGYLAVSRRIGVSPRADRHITLEDSIDNLSKTFLGLSVGCARCHDHKFDPIPTSDYYAIYGILDSSVYPFAGEEHRPYRQDFVFRVGKEKADQLLAPYQAQLAPWIKKEREKFEEYQSFQDRRIDTPGRSREVVWRELQQVRDELRKVAETFPPLETAYAITEGNPHDVAIQRMGDPRMPGPKARRGFLQILGGQLVPENGGSGRLALANWIADPANPLTARVMANRIWHYHFGQGLVPTTSDFGVRGTPPSNPALLDYLASQFVANGWSIKTLHRQILLSEAYQLASTSVPANQAVDPQNLLHWRQNRRRLDAEAISDTLRLLSGSLDLTPGQRHPMPNERTYFYRQHEPFAEVYANPKRTIYGIQQRFQKNPYLDLFDGPDGNLQMAERKSTTTSLQALWLMNSAFLQQQSDAIAEKLLQSAPDANRRLQWTFTNLYGRPAAPPELAQANQFLAKLSQQHAQAGCTGAVCQQRTWSSLVRAMAASNPFLFIE